MLPLSADTLSVQETVDSHAGPWQYVNGGMNTNYQYGVGDQSAPLVINAAEGFNFAAGGSFTFQYLSGLVSAGPGFAFVDANGNVAFPFNGDPGSSGQFAPSKFMDPNTYPINLAELVGTFTNSSGTIVGTPFAIGDGPFTIAIPVGASALQLGINDDIYKDNQGAFVLDVTGPVGQATPEPGSLALLGIGIGLFGVGTRIHRIARRARV